MTIADIGRLLSSDSRVRILSALMGGQALPASELAFRAGVSNPTTSEHLKALEGADLISGRKCGRHRYYEIKNAEVASSLETFSVLVGAVDQKRHRAIPERMVEGRFCYDHLAGRLGVSLTRRLCDCGALEVNGQEYTLAQANHPILGRLGIDSDRLKKERRRLAPQCIDWSERVPHVAGALGASLARSLTERGWISRHKDDRSIVLTDLGKTSLSSELGIIIAIGTATLTNRL